MQPMEGVTVVELTTYKAAPSCGRILLTQGARVIKVEPPKGDVERGFGATLKEPVAPDENPNFDTTNGGKEFVMLDLKSEEDKERFFKLLEHADVFITNNRHQALVKMGIDYESIKDRFPRLIYATLLGYGEYGPRKDSPGFDAVAMFADVGFNLDMMIDAPGNYPTYLPMGFGDMACGAMLAGQIGTALYRREKCGEGEFVTVSLYGAGIWFSSIMSTGTQFGYKWPRGRYEGGPMGVPYKTADDVWVLPVVNEYERYWRQFCEACGADEIIDDPRFCTKQATFDPKNREDCIKYFEKCIAKCNSDEMLQKMWDADIIISKMGHFKDGHTSEQALANNYVAPITYPNGDSITLAQHPIRMTSMKPPVAQVSKPIGADNEAIFKEFGL